MKSINQMAAIVFGELEESDIEHLRTIADAEDMIRYHHTIGRHIRNRFKLWDYCDRHPDEASHEVLKKVWEMAQEC